MHSYFARVEIDHIDLSDTAFKISTDTPPDDLAASIEEIGLIAFPILKESADNRHTVVSGFRRIGACRALGWGSMDARIIRLDESDLDCMKLAIADNALNRQLNVIEQAVSITKLSSFYPDDITLSREAQKIGLIVNPGLIRKLKKVTTVHEQLKKGIASGNISLTIGLELGELEPDAAAVMAQIIEELNPTLSHQKEIIRFAKEISRLNNRPVNDVIHDCIKNNLIKNTELDRNQKIKSIRSQLRQIRYPEIVRFESNYITSLQSLKLPESIKLVPPADFESSIFSMHLKFQNLSQFNDICDILNKLPEQPDFNKILEKHLEDN